MFSALLLKVLPLYTTILLGFVAGKFVKLDSATIGKVLFYIISPMVVFFGILKIKISPEFMSLPVFTFVICCVMSFIVYKVSALVFRDHTRNMLAFSSGSSSMGFFGLPVAIALFDEETVSVYLLCYVGMLFFENSFGFYIVTQRLYTPKQCAKRLFLLPAFHAAVSALLLNYYEVHIPLFLTGIAPSMTNTYMVLGMILLGVTIANIKDSSIDFKLITTTVLIKYVAWPLVILALIFLDRTGPKWYNSQVYQSLILLAIIPVSTTGVILASMFNYQPDRAAMILLISTVIGMFYVPLMISLLFM
ncbi:AEC family transporter [Candidatus Anaplasma sp. TIGMIC]|uniref:AEC family transporter n=1 Tax=Candidatus Anaplasma sp. TIGMIC TaxID=3020713 RepID=UPI00232FB29D|nr:AEC family transporter [Candidatus Anaplasma sp. TIGMIC]MDB1135586.1 AEC family transporter [Candidatus Anaplasma sp. TIGMIC]